MCISNILYFSRIVHSLSLEVIFTKKQPDIIIQIILLLDRHSSHRLSETMYKAIVVISNINNMHPSFTASLV